MVYLVGAGPGDPELITVKGMRLISSADVIIYDRLVGEALLGFARPGAEKIFAGKESSYHSKPQEEINLLMAEKASRGASVVRLKGGDPFIFGRGGEEARFLASRGIPFEVVPGVTAACGTAASALIPLTDRSLSSAVTFVAGHRMTGRGIDDLPWAELSAQGNTLVFYMGLTNLPSIASMLIENGKPPATPAAVVSSATVPGEKVVSSTLEGITAKTREAGISPPALLIIGEVVGLREALGAPCVKV